MEKHNKKTFIRVFFVFVLALMTWLTLGTAAMALTDSSAGKVRNDTNYGIFPLFFIPNQGQFDDQVAYAIQGKDKSIYFTSQGLTFVLTEQVGASSSPEPRMLREITPKKPGPQTSQKRWSVKLDFVGARHNAVPESLEQAETVVSYFKGGPEEWKTGLQTSSRIIYRNLWPGIDLVYYGTVNRLKYDFIVHPGADPAQIRLAYRGADSLRVTIDGRLEVKTPLGDFQDEIPVAWQENDGEKTDVSVVYALDAAAGIQVATLSTGKSDTGKAIPIIHPRKQDYSYGFKVGDYDRSRTLVLDPEMLVYCGFIGGSDINIGNAIAVDGAGNAYVTGATLSTEVTFPVTIGPDLTPNGDADTFVAKVNADGTALVYCGYIGGSGSDYGLRISVDDEGNAYVVGYTDSTEATFPVAVGPDLTYNGGTYDAFVAKINADGTSLVYSGYIGGFGSDYGRGIVVDGGGNAHVTGWTNSTETSFPVKVGPDLTYNGGNYDAFVAKVNADGTALVYSGYIGGEAYDYGNAIDVDGAGNAYITGYTRSTETSFPVKVGPDLTYNGYNDAFVAKVNADGTALVFCGYIGGLHFDIGRGIAVDSGGNAFVTGETGSTVNWESHFPVKVGPDLTYNGGHNDAFVAKVNADGTDLIYCGFIGGGSYDYGYDIAVDGAGNAYVTGTTGTTLSTEATFPVTIGPDLTHNGGDYDAFVAEVNADGTNLIYSGYIGGSGSDYGLGIAVDSAGNAYVVGDTDSTEASFPVTAGPDLTHNGGAYDVFVAKITPAAVLDSDFWTLMIPVIINKAGQP